MRNPLARNSPGAAPYSGARPSRSQPRADVHGDCDRCFRRRTCELAGRCTARFPRAVVGMGALGIIGFSAAGMGIQAAWLNVTEYIALALGSLGLFGLSALTAYLGDPHTLRHIALRKAQAAERAFVPEHLTRRTRARGRL